MEEPNCSAYEEEIARLTALNASYRHWAKERQYLLQTINFYETRYANLPLDEREIRDELVKCRGELQMKKTLNTQGSIRITELEDALRKEYQKKQQLLVQEKQLLVQEAETKAVYERDIAEKADLINAYVADNEQLNKINTLLTKELAEKKEEIKDKNAENDALRTDNDSLSKDVKQKEKQINNLKKKQQQQQQPQQQEVDDETQLLTEAERQRLKDCDELTQKFEKLKENMKDKVRQIVELGKEKQELKERNTRLFQRTTSLTQQALAADQWQLEYQKTYEILEFTMDAIRLDEELPMIFERVEVEDDINLSNAMEAYLQRRNTNREALMNMDRNLLDRIMKYKKYEKNEDLKRAAEVLLKRLSGRERTVTDVLKLYEKFKNMQ